MASRVFKTTSAMIGLLERFLKLSIHVEGLENISDRPTLFVVNHFTRMETFIVPYVLDKHTDKPLRALADAKLFKGLFGEYLRRMGAYSTREPLRNRMIIGDLVTGRHDWVIFPEGVMVKSKKVVHHGRLQMTTLRQKRRPHTGAAVLALKAALVRERFLSACHEENKEILEELEERYGLEQEMCLISPGIVITPVNITFYPLRPNDNTISRIATSLVKDIPEHLLEELKTEGSMLLHHTDMTIYFSPAIEVDEYLSRPVARLRGLPLLTETQRENLVLSTQRWPLTSRFMNIIYSTTAINMDHLFCIGLRELKTDCIRIEDFHRALYLAAMTIHEHDNRRIHSTLYNKLIRIVADEVHEPLEDIYELAKREGIVVRKNGAYHVARRKLTQAAALETVRLRGTTKVIANEVEPLSFAVQAVDRYVNMSPKRMRNELVRRLSESDIAHFESEYALYYKTGLSKAPAIGRPFFLRAPQSTTGILLCHGYLAAPEEMRPMGEFLHEAGYTVYGARLQGFGTSPDQLREVSWKDWLVSFNRAYAILRNCCDRIILCGFSAGALLVLLNAATKSRGVLESIVCIDTPLILMNRHACTIAPAALGLNRMMKKMGLGGTILSSIENRSETPDINYPVNYLEGVRELCNLMSVCRDHLPEVVTPCLIIHGSADPVADPESADVIYKTVSSPVKKQVTVDADFHNLVQKEGREKIFQHVLDFIHEREARIAQENVA